MTDRALMTTALLPVVIYLAAMMAILAMDPSHFPAPLLAGGGTFVVMLSVGFANILRMRRDRKRKSI